MEPIKILDLFAGAGGLSLGFESVLNSRGGKAFELYRAAEIDKFACETLRNRHGSEKIIEGDIRKLATANRIISECKGKVSVIVGGIPCQSFSLIGPRSGFGKKLEKFREDDRDNLYEHFRDIVAAIEPKVIVIENVKGILSKKDGAGRLIIDKIVSDFKKLGFRFKNNENDTGYALLNAADFGVPQKRERIILIGVNEKLGARTVPLIEPTHYNPDCGKTNLRDEGLLPYVTLKEAIGDLPKVKPKFTKTDLNPRMIRRIEKINRKIYSGEDTIPFDKQLWNEHLAKVSQPGKLFLQFVRPNGYPYITHHIARSQQFSDVRLFSTLKPGETAEEFLKRAPKMAGQLIKYDMTSFMDKYRRQDGSKLCTTLFAHLEKDGNRFIHPVQARTFTVREAARVQSFPDDFVFCGPYSKKFRQIGNAVPPLLGKKIGEAVLQIL